MRTQIAVALLLLTSAVVEGEEAHLLADLNQDFASATGSTPWFYAALPDAVVFTARSLPGEWGHHQLWRSDGTPQGTFPIAEICDSDSGIDRTELLGVVGGVALFRFHSCLPEQPSGLWSSDGTAAGTYSLVVAGRGNPLSYPGGVNATRATVLGDQLFFTSLEPDSDRHELWRTDGTRAGTQRVAVFNQTIETSNVAAFVAVGDRLVLVLDGTTRYEVWRSDGMTAGTVLAEDRLSLRGQTFAASGTHLFSSAGQRPLHLLALDGKVGGIELVWYAPEVSSISSPIRSATGIAFIASYDYEPRTQIWHSNGLPGGTVAWTGEFPSSQRIHSSAEGAPTLAFLGSHLFFLADCSENEVGLYMTNGSADSVRLVETLPQRPGQPDPWVFALGDKLFFPRADDDGLELWVSNGNSGDGRKVIDACAGECDARPGTPVAFGTRLFWTARETGGGKSLWVTDVTTMESTRLAHGLQRFGCSRFSEDNLELYPAAGRWHFSAKDFLHGCEPWAAREAPDSGELIGDLLVDKPGLEDLASVNHDGLSTYLVAPRAFPSRGDLVVATHVASQPEVLFEGVQRRCGLTYRNSIVGVLPIKRAVLFVEDECESFAVFARERGAGIVSQLFGPARPDRPEVARVIPAPSGAGLYLQTGGSLSDLWLTDGTEGGTTSIAELPPFTRFMGRIDERLLVWSVWAAGGADLVFLDTVSRQASRIVGPRRGGSLLLPIPSSARGLLYFQADSSSGWEYDLWRTDGTQEGTRAIFQTPSGDQLLGASGFGSDIVFSVRRRDGRIELLRFGEEFLTAELLWSTSEAPSSGFFGVYPQAFDKGLLFHGWDPEHGPELWLFDPQTRRTTRLTETPGVYGPVIIGAGRLLGYFARTNEQQQLELWRTDGTTAGTIRLGDWQYGVAGDRSLAIVDERLYYTFDDGIHGEEIWTSDGSPGGTRLLADVVPGATGSQPSSFTAANHALYFLADDGIHGREIWTIPAGHAPPRRR